VSRELRLEAALSGVVSRELRLVAFLSRVVSREVRLAAFLSGVMSRELRPVSVPLRSGKPAGATRGFLSPES